MSAGSLQMDILALGGSCKAVASDRRSPRSPTHERQSDGDVRLGHRQGPSRHRRREDGILKNMPIDPRNIEVIDEEMAAVFRAMTGAQRLKIASDMFDSARRMILSHLAAEHPDWDEQRLQQETARRLSHGAV